MRINLHCPYAEKDEAKVLGAKWDAERKTWYVVNPHDLTIFARWLTDEQKKEFSRKLNKKWPVTKMDERYRKFVCGCDVLPWEACIHTF
jgi:hypothetical protein